MLSSLRKTFPFRDWLMQGDDSAAKRPNVASIAHGDVITFAALEQSDLSGKSCIVGTPTVYHFNGSQFTSYPLFSMTYAHLCQMIIAGQETDTPYLALSKKIPDAHKAELCMDEDYTRLQRGDMPQHLYVREHTAGMVDWLHMHYELKIPLARGTSIAPDNEVKTFDYSLYVSLKEYKALEIERFASGDIIAYATVFRPAEDIITIDRGAAPRRMTPPSHEKTKPASKTQNPPTKPTEKPSTTSKIKSEANNAQDSAQIFELPVHTPTPATVPAKPTPGSNRLIPAMPHDGNHSGAIQVNLRMASKLVDEALRNDMRVTDVIRKALGLGVHNTDQVSFDLQLSEKDYKVLADRFDVDLSDKDKIHEFIMEELSHFTGEPQD